MELDQLLIFSAGSRLCALPVSHVAETLRPLPIDPLPDAPAYVAGACVLRGAPTPVVDLGVLVNGAKLEQPRRLVALKVGTRQVGVLADGVIGLRPGTSLAAGGLPPLLSHCSTDIIAQLARLDQAFLTVLKLGSIIPDDVWVRLEART